MGLTSRRTHRLLLFISKPLLAALFVTLLLRWTFQPKTPQTHKPVKKHPNLTQALIIASTPSSNLTWLPPALENTNWKPYIYTSFPSSQNPPNLSSNQLNNLPNNPEYIKLANKGNEANPYLTYIIDNYDNLPDIMFFHHHHAQSWHQSFSSHYELSHLNPLTVLRDGYLSPRCLPGCENVIELSGDVMPVQELSSAVSRDILIASVLREFWVDEHVKGREKVPKKIAGPCCAQFAVSREAVRRRSRGEWERLRNWLLETRVGDRESGRLLEYTWHLWFGMEDEFCPDEATCLCDVYGVGDCEGEL